MRWAALVLLAALPGCRAVSDVAGVVAAGVSGSATANPAIGIAVGIGVRAGVDEVRKYVVRHWQEGEQDAIADAAGSLPIGGRRAWEIRHSIPIGNERGELEPVREWSTPLTTCREIVFSVVDDGERELFTTTLCRDGRGWKWAAAEPAVERWGFLQ